MPSANRRCRRKPEGGREGFRSKLVLGNGYIMEVWDAEDMGIHGDLHCTSSELEENSFLFTCTRPSVR